jgi:predicted nucleotidyltransferase
VTPAALEPIVDFIVRSLDPQAVILFGSVARGAAEPGSDIDLVVLGRFRERRRSRARELRVLRERYAMPVDVQCYTPEEFAGEAADGASFAAMVARHGIRLYEKA